MEASPFPADEAAFIAWALPTLAALAARRRAMGGARFAAHVHQGIAAAARDGAPERVRMLLRLRAVRNEIVLRELVFPGYMDLPGPDRVWAPVVRLYDEVLWDVFKS